MRCIDVKRGVSSRRNGHLCIYCNTCIKMNEEMTALRFDTLRVFGVDKLPRYAHERCYDKNI